MDIAFYFASKSLHDNSGLGDSDIQSNFPRRNFDAQAHGLDVQFLFGDDGLIYRLRRDELIAGCNLDALAEEIDIDRFGEFLLAFVATADGIF